jgi:hypothetical protein
MLKHIFVALTGIDGATIDFGRVLIALACLVGIGLEVYAVVFTKPFDIQAFGIGMGTLLLSGGGMLFAKKDTEPSGNSNGKTIEKVSVERTTSTPAEPPP